MDSLIYGITGKEFMGAVWRWVSCLSQYKNDFIEVVVEHCQCDQMLQMTEMYATIDIDI